MLTRLGWHWAFLPTIVAEALPGADLFPSWTAALLFVSHDRSRSSEPEVLEPEPIFGQHEGLGRIRSRPSSYAIAVSSSSENRVFDLPQVMFGLDTRVL